MRGQRRTLATDEPRWLLTHSRTLAAPGVLGAHVHVWMRRAAALEQYDAGLFRDLTEFINHKDQTGQAFGAVWQEIHPFFRCGGTSWVCMRAHQGRAPGPQRGHCVEWVIQLHGWGIYGLLLLPRTSQPQAAAGHHQRANHLHPVCVGRAVSALRERSLPSR